MYRPQSGGDFGENIRVTLRRLDWTIDCHARKDGGDWYIEDSDFDYSLIDDDAFPDWEMVFSN
jgi:hypothetical protein